MLSKRELREYSGSSRVWTGRYKNLTNLPHWHSDIEIIYAEKGNAKVSIGENNYILHEGRCIFIESKQTHYIKAEQSGILSFILFDDGLCENITKSCRLFSPILSCSYGIPEIINKINEETEKGGKFSDYSVSNRIERLVIDIFSSERTVAAKEENSYESERFRSLITDIDVNYANYTPRDAADFLSLSESYFPKYFKHMANISFTDYLNLVKTEKAIAMLKEKKDNITKISIACGFGTIRNFNRVFRAITGFTPRELPSGYDILGFHPKYVSEESFNPTSKDSELI